MYQLVVCFIAQQRMKRSKIQNSKEVIHEEDCILTRSCTAGAPRIRDCPRTNIVNDDCKK